jgi:hypothetical protein
MNEDKALAVLSPEEVQQERFALLVVFGDDESDGQGLGITGARKRLGLSGAVARRWWRSQFVQDRVREYLEITRRDTQVRALRLRSKALLTLEKAMSSPAYTPTQRAAAKDILSLGMGEAISGGTNVGLVVNVNTGLPPAAMLQQQRRHGKQDDIVEGEATPVE